MTGSSATRLGLAEVKAKIEPEAGPARTGAREAEVIVIGAGPIGLTVANLLGSYGLDTVLVERNALTADLPRAIVVDDEFMRLLHRIGVGGELSENVSPPFGIYFYSRKGVPVVKVPPFYTSNGFGKRCGVMQPVLEKILLDAACRRDTVDIRYSTELVSFEEGADSVECRLRPAGGEEYPVRARYLLACDGARSVIRTALQIPFEGERIDQPHLVLDLADFPDDSPYSRFFCNPQRPLNSVPAPYGGRRLEFMLMPGDDRDAIVGDDSIRHLIDNFSPYRGVEPQIVRRAVYGFSQRLASVMQKGRVFLLGDAAHVMPPFGAQAMNTGARDASNLAWKLTFVLRHGWSDSLLAEYDAERRPHVVQTIRYSVRIGAFANIASRPLAFLRDTAFSLLMRIPAVNAYFSEMRYMPRPRISSSRIVAGSKPELAGTLFPRIEVEGKPIDELTGGRICIVTIDGDTESGAAAERIVADSDCATVLALSANGSDGKGVRRITRGYGLEKLGGHLLVVRPDWYIAGVFSLPLDAQARSDIARLVAPAGASGMKDRQIEHAAG